VGVLQARQELSFLMTWYRPGVPASTGPTLVQIAPAAKLSADIRVFVIALSI
jgi:hypothetical protein